MDRIIGTRLKTGTPQGPIRVLAVDDDPSVLRFLEMFLDGDGYEVRLACTGEDGFLVARDWVPDLVLLDRGLPDSDGEHVVQRLKADDRTRDIPIIVLTTRSTVDEKVKSLDVDVDDTITKPFDIGELRTRLAWVVARKRERSLITEAEKLDTLRKVIASVSHEVNNPLATILMSAEALEGRYEDNPDIGKKSRLIQENVIRIRDILKRLERVRSVVPKPYVASERILDLGEEDDGEP